MRRAVILLLLLLPASAAADPPVDEDTDACHAKSPAFLPAVAGCKLATCGDEDDGDESFQLSLGKDGVGEFEDRSGRSQWWAYECGGQPGRGPATTPETADPAPVIAKKAEASLRAHGWKIVYAGAPDQSDTPKEKRRDDLRVITASKGTVFVRVESPDPDDEDEPSYSVTWLDGKKVAPCTHDCD